MDYKQPFDGKLVSIEDPRRFLQKYQDGAILDETQYSPGLLSCIQFIVDNSGKQGLFIITGSQHFPMIEKISQSLAGRVGIINLLPFSFSELEHAGINPKTLDEMMFKGSYPPLYDQPLVTERWLNSYISTYIERCKTNSKHKKSCCFSQISYFMRRECWTDDKFIQNWRGLRS